jgi:hypothetical protein
LEVCTLETPGLRLITVHIWDALWFLHRLEADTT